MSAASTLAAWGMLLPDDLVAAAAQANLPLHYAAALVEQESGNGRNVWGSDAVDTGGVYSKGAPVTREGYLNYRALVDQGRIGSQGVGPCQLTSRGYQVAADAIGGCWQPRANMIIGFKALADLMRQHGDDGIRRYNGSGPAAERYRISVQSKATLWSIILGTQSVVPVTTGEPAPATRKDDDQMMNIPIVVDARDGSFRGAAIVEAGTSSKAIAQAWIALGVLWGPAAGIAADYRLAFLGVDGTVMGPANDIKRSLANNGREAWPVPSGAVMATLEGRLYGGISVLAAAVITKAA